MIDVNITNPENIFSIKDVKVFWGDGHEGARSILYIPQNYLSGLVHNTDKEKSKLKDFAKKLFEKHEDFKSLLSSWEKSNEVISQKISQNVTDILKGKEKLNEKEMELKREGDLKSAEATREDFQKSVAEMQGKTQITKEELGEYDKIKKNLLDAEKKLKELGRDVSALEFLGDLEIINVDLLNDIELSQKTENKIKSQLEEKGESIDKFITEEIKDLKKEIGIKEKEVKNNKELIKPYKEKMEGEKLLKKLSDQLIRQESKIQKIKKIEQEIATIKEANKDKRNELEEEYKKRKKTIDQVVEKFTSFGKNFEFIKIEIEKIFNAEEVANLRRQFNLSGSKNKTQYDLVKFLEDGIQPKDFDKALLCVVDGIICGDIVLRKSEDMQLFIIRLLGNFYDVNYQEAIRDKNDGTILLNMSDGQKMNALLELLFSFDDDNFPIFIDQPEDDLDVTAITKHIVNFIKNKKESRQIIIVSHNANLVVGSDSENIIVSRKRLKNGFIEGFSYTNGAIENESIKSEIINILEGGKEAFKKRGKKLNIHRNFVS